MVDVVVSLEARSLSLSFPFLSFSTFSFPVASVGDGERERVNFEELGALHQRLGEIALFPEWVGVMISKVMPRHVGTGEESGEG